MRIDLRLQISDQGLVWSFVFIAVGFLFIDIWQYSLESAPPKSIAHIFDITLESNIPTWYSSLLAVAASLIAFLIGRYCHAGREWLQTAGWYAIAAFFLYLSIDDASQLHERIASVLSESIKESPEVGLLTSWIETFRSYYWQVIFLPFFILMGVFMLWFLSREFGDRASFFLFLAGLTCYATAVGMDYSESITPWLKMMVEGTTVTVKDLRHLFRAVEECIEMVGTSLILVAFLRQLSSRSMQSV